MRRNTLWQIIGLIWVVLLVRAYLAYDWAKSSYISSAGWTRDLCESDGLVGDCFESLLAYEVLNSIFWGIFATVLLLFTYDAVAILDYQVSIKEEKEEKEE